MKQINSIRLISVLYLVSVNTLAIAQGAWTQKATAGTSLRSIAVGFSIGTKGYMGTGYDGSGDLADFWEYDPVTNVWTQKANFGGGARNSAVGFSIGTKGYIGTGSANSTLKNDLWEYNPATNTWAQKTSLPGVARRSAVAFTVSSKAYICTGVDGSNALKDCWEYDPAGNSWTQKTNFGGTSRYYASGFSAGTKGYVGLGYDPTVGGSVADYWEYNPATNAWTMKGYFPGGVRERANSLTIGTKVYLGMGYKFGGYSDWWEYNPATNGWFQLTDFPATGFGRYSSTTFAIGAKGYVGNGFDINGSTNDFWEFDPSKISPWTKKGSLGYGFSPSYKPAAAAIGNMGYVSTGFSGTANSLETFEYDPATGYPASMANFSGAARQGAAAFSIGNKFYLGTGYDGSNKNDFWEFDPNAGSSGAWTQKANFGGSARSFAVGFSINSKGYICTGYDGAAKTDLWEYNPATNTWAQKASISGSARYAASGFVVNSKGYVGTGFDGSSALNDFWEYNPGTNTWTQKANFAGGVRINAASFSIGSKGYLGTGSTDGTLLKKDFWEYNPVTNAWTQKDDFTGTPRWGAAGFSIAGASLGFIAGGKDANYLAEVWEYDPLTLRITQLLPLATCKGDTIQIGYKIAQGISTVYFQLSDAAGSFTSPATLGNITDSSGFDTVKVRIPLSTGYGTGYRLRMVSATDTSNTTDSFTIGTQAFAYASQTNLCPGDSATLSSAGFGYGFMWLKNGSPATPGFMANDIFYADTTASYRVIVRNPAGCVDTSSSVNVVIQPRPIASFTINNTIQCVAANNFVFTNTSSIASGSIVSHKWNLGASANDTSVSQNSSKSYTIANTYTVSLEETSLYGCKDSISKTITVQAQPKAGFTVNTTSQCLNGNNFIFSDTTSGVAVHSWNFGAGTNDTSSLPAPAKTYNNVSAFSVKLIVATSAGCKDSATKNITVLSSPAQPTFSVLPDSVACSNVPIILRTAATDTRSWLKSGNPLGVAADSLVVNNAAGAYSLKVTNVNNCSSFSGIVNLVFIPVPGKPTVTISGSILTSSSTIGNQWYNALGVISGQTGQTFAATSPGDYYTIVTANGCSSPASDIVHFTGVGIASVNTADLSVYPNPNNGNFTIALNKKIDGDVVINIVDLAGRVVYNTRQNTDDQLNIRTNNLANGTYLVTVQTNNELYRVKIVINH